MARPPAPSQPSFFPLPLNATSNGAHTTRPGFSSSSSPIANAGYDRRRGLPSTDSVPNTTEGRSSWPSQRPRRQRPSTGRWLRCWGQTCPRSRRRLTNHHIHTNTSRGHAQCPSRISRSKELERTRAKVWRPRRCQPRRPKAGSPPSIRRAPDYWDGRHRPISPFIEWRCPGIYPRPARCHKKARLSRRISRRDDQKLTSSSKPRKAPVPVQQQARLPKSTATDLGTRIHEDISSWNYECAICTDDVVRASHVWSCTVCWTVVHLKCAKKWYGNQKRQDDLQSSEPQREFSWRCPGCNSKLLDDPGSYHCWCGKDINPPPSSAALPPHSCGQTCSKPRATCPHPCSLQCHAGPCPPCGLTGPTQSCFCGKSTSRKLCRETDYENGWSCQEICGDLLPCGEHFCSKPCHSGLCGDCDMKVEAKCYCGRVEKQMPCYERGEPEQSHSPMGNGWFEGTFSCNQLCQRRFDCGVHKCSEPCHAQDELPSHCPYAPDTITHCPCGKTPLDQLLDQPRQSCEDGIPHCNRPCEKLLPCGHLCRAECHTGDCGFCNETMDIPCRCGRTSTKSVCHQGDVQHPLCMRTCQANLSCGRHKCGEHCCQGERKAAERQAARRKNRPASDVNSIEPEHICIRTCGRPLKCGSHDCQQMCHRGPCSSCPEAIFHEISCDCGRTVLQPPQPCGTRPPECRFSCQRRPVCGHPPVDHNCHPDDMTCPKCPFLVEKWCACGKEKLQSQPCHLQAAHCGRPCGRKLKCGYVPETIVCPSDHRN